MKLYKLVTHNYEKFYVVAEHPTAAVDAVANFLRKHAYNDEAEVSIIELVAEASRYPSCKRILLFDETAPSEHD